MPSCRNRLRVAALAAALLAAGTAGALPARAATPTRVETPVTTGSPVTGVTESVVRVKVPLPASAGPHPAACDWLSYLRYRDATGPADSAAADRVLVAQPGILEGAGAFDSVARDTVARAAALGRHIEFWALDRRSNCLEDHTGIAAARAAGDPALAVDYYYRGKAVDGRTFAGFLGNDQVGWLAHVGLEQTVRDEYDLLRAELPDQRLRKQKVLCGGHSLGGVLTGFFATWDFDGNHSTTGDAGYNQCAGYFALDTTISTSLADLSGTVPSGATPDPALGYTAIQAGLESGLLPRTVSAPVVINPETMNLLALAGLDATLRPDAESDLLQSIPSDTDIDLSGRVLFSKDLATFLTGTPAVKDFRLTNDAVLGALMDDNSQPLSVLQASVGFFDGGPLATKEFPATKDTASNPLLSGLGPLLTRETLAIPDQPHGPLYTWRNYNRVGAPDDPGYRDKDGNPFTTAAKEVTDIQELARSLAEQPLDFTEQYFPTKIVTDIQLAAAPQIGADAVHTEGLTANPTLTVLAGDGVLAGRIPEHLHPVVAPGYQHLDVLTAAPARSDGLPEPVSTALGDFAAR